MGLAPLAAAECSEGSILSSEVSISMHQASLGRSRRFDSRAGIENAGHQPDTHSVLSGGSKMSKLCTKEPVVRRITFRDVQLIMPTVIILVFTIVIMITVIPYAFSSVLKQMEAVRALEAASELRRSISAGAGAVLEDSNVTQT